MSTEDHQYDLKWTNFESNMTSAFNELRKSQDLFDITLITDQSQIPAHKMILAACSPYFHKIIKRLENVQKPGIYLRGVRDHDIKSILDFMYVGEIRIGQEDFDSVMALAMDLGIKGLVQTGEQPQMSQSPSTKRIKTEDSQQPQESVEATNVKMEPSETSFEEDAKGEEHDDDDDEPIGLAQLPDGKATCLKCGKTLSNMRNGTRHYKLVHTIDKNDLKWKCKMCPKKFSTTIYLNAHLSRSHGITQAMMKARVVPKFKEEIPEDED
jgi:hypothetical protein